MHRPTISLIVPVYRGGREFQQCLASIRAADPAPDEVIIAIDSSAENPTELDEFEGMHVVRLSSRLGPAAARNAGARAASSDLLFFVDADVTIQKSTIAQIRQLFAFDSDLAAAIGSYDDRPAAPNFLSQFKNLVHHFTHQTSSPDGFTFWGACGVIRRRVFEQVGGFDTAYRRPSIEDIELGYRLKAKGFRIRLCKEIQVKHLKQWRFRSLLKSDFFDRALPWSRLILKGNGFHNELNISVSERLKVSLAILLLFLASLALWHPPLVMLLAAVMLQLFSMDGALWKFFHEKRGLRFVVLSIPWRWSYYIYSGLAFVIGLAERWSRALIMPLGRPARSSLGKLVNEYSGR